MTVYYLLMGILAITVIVMVIGQRTAKTHNKSMMDEQAEIQRDIARNLDRIATALEAPNK